MALAALGCLALSLLALPAAADPVHLDDTTSTADDSTAKKYPELIEAQKKFQAQDFDGALEVLRAAVKTHPELSHPRVILATFFFAANRVPAGRQALEKAVQDAPDDPEAYLMMGEIALREGQWTEAGLLFDKAAPLAAAYKGDAERTKKMQIRVQAGQATVAEAREQWEPAQKYLQAWVKLDPKSGAAHHRLGRALFHTDQKAAYTELQTAAKMDAKSPSAEVTVAKLFQLKANNETTEAQKKVNRDYADKWMQSAVTQSPKDLKVRLEVGQWLWENGRYADAKKQADEALKLDPNSLEALLLSGLVSRYSKDYGAAAEYFQRAYNQSPSNVAAGAQLALSLVEQNDEAKKRKALEYIDSLMKQNPRSAEIAAAAGWICYRLGRLDDAERLLQAAANSGSVNLDTLYIMAKLSADRGNLNQAKQLLQAR